MRCEIYKASTRSEMYLYIRSDMVTTAEGEPDALADPLSQIPEALRQALGRPTWIMQLELSLERKLARVAVQDVLEALARQGYYLQLPPDGLISPTALAPEGLRGA